MESLADILKRAQTVRGSGVETPAPPQLCPVCHGAGYLRYDVPISDPRFGQLVACECTRREMEQRRLERLVEKSNLGALRRLTFNSFILKYRDTAPPPRTPDAACRLAREYADHPDGWLVFYGSYGSGKTHLAVAIANHRLSLGEQAVFIVVPDLLDHLRSTFSPSSDVTYDELFESVRNAPLLILDDLGTQTTTPWAQEKLYQILNHRYNRRLPTVITTNLSPDAIDARLRSRLGDPQISRLCEIVGKDVRLGVTHEKPSRQAAASSRRSGPRVREEGQI